MIRNPKDFWSGLIFLAFGMTAVVLARDYGMGSATKMGPGYFPTVLGTLLALIGLATATRALFSTGTGIGAFALPGMLLVTGATVLFGLLLRGAGLVPALIVLVLVSAFASRYFRWGPALALAAGLAAFSALVFVQALKLPMALFGPWLRA
ncbi:MAG: tripartite tricarboxylate transporter TctB family protein [Gammaproteobacteria bacterium]